MKVAGPADPPVPPAPKGRGRPDADATAGAAEPDEPGPETRAAAGSAPTGTIAVGDLAADLQAGRLTRVSALEKLVDRVIGGQLGADAAPAIREKLRAALAEALDSDPLFAERLKALG